jgi:transcriptional regulator with XRE-family HTH domain
MESELEKPPRESSPAYDEVYERIIREQLDRASLSADFARGVAKRFRDGPLTLCSRSIGKWINRKLRAANWTQQVLADKLGVDRSAVAYWIGGGNITFANLVGVLIEFDCQWTDLPLPAREEMAVEAYLAALAFTQEKLHPASAAAALDRERFWCLYHLFAEPHWERAIRRQDPDLLRQEAQRILDAAEGSLGSRPRAVIGVDGIKQLVREWGLAWLVCVWQAPRSWNVA